MHGHIAIKLVMVSCTQYSIPGPHDTDDIIMGSEVKVTDYFSARGIRHSLPRTRLEIKEISSFNI